MGWWEGGGPLVGGLLSLCVAPLGSSTPRASLLGAARHGHGGLVALPVPTPTTG